VAERDLDVVVLGATGVTGRQVARYLAERAQGGGLRWAPAARDTAKLERVLDELGVRAPELIAADVGDPATLATMASRTRVVLDLVGPYTRFGRPVVEACLAAGTHYVDLTGELPFVREMIDAFHEQAVARGVKIVQVCGFEALPADLLVALAVERARELFDEGLAEVDLQVSMTAPPGMPRATDMVSGGTFQSLAEVAAAKDSALITDPAMLIADAELAERVRRISPIGLSPRRGEHGAVIAPMAPAAFINPAVIHRSAALIAAAEGRAQEPFRYREGITLAGGALTQPARWALAGTMSGTQVVIGALAHARPALRTRVAGLLGRFGPASGFGPSGERMEHWRWSVSVLARTHAGRQVRAHLDADGHPGYLATARLLGEAGILLAQDDATPARGGCLTPAGALGTSCVASFEHARLRFSLDT